MNKFIMRSMMFNCSFRLLLLCPLIFSALGQTTSSLSTLAPSKTPEVMCFTGGTYYSPHSVVVLKRRLLNSQTDVKYSGGVQAQVNCGSIEASVKCPEADNVTCSNVKTCYVYESSNVTNDHHFTVLELFVRKTGDSPDSVECRNRERKDCPVFNKTASITGFAVGILDSCVPRSNSIAKNGVFLPSIYPDVVCKLCDRYSNSPEVLHTGKTVSSDVDRFSSNLLFTLSCSDLKANVTCSSGNGTSNFLCSAVRKCYRYEATYTYTRLCTFNVMELSFRKTLNELYYDTIEVNCTDSFGKCPVFKETESTVKFVIGFPYSCRPTTPTK